MLRPGSPNFSSASQFYRTGAWSHQWYSQLLLSAPSCSSCTGCQDFRREKPLILCGLFPSETLPVGSVFSAYWAPWRPPLNHVGSRLGWRFRFRPRPFLVTHPKPTRYWSFSSVKPAPIPSRLTYSASFFSQHRSFFSTAAPLPPIF